MKDLLCKRSKWTQGTSARTNDDKPCKIENPQASKFCLLGAFGRCYGLLGSKDTNYEVYRKLCSKTGGITSWNDDPNRTYGDVKRLLEELDI
jgi:hypothetical protein